MEESGLRSIKEKKSSTEGAVVRFEVQSSLKKDPKRMIAAKIGNVFIELGTENKKSLAGDW